MSSDQVMLHHYPQPPVTEKVRVVLGMKDLTWKSVEIPRLPPKPNLMPLAGGYRLTPVMQIGADIYPEPCMAFRPTVWLSCAKMNRSVGSASTSPDPDFR